MTLSALNRPPPSIPTTSARTPSARFSWYPGGGLLELMPVAQDERDHGDHHVAEHCKSGETGEEAETERDPASELGETSENGEEPAWRCAVFEK